MRLAIVTCRTHPQVSRSDSYYVAALEEIGAHVNVVPWNVEETADLAFLETLDGVILRSPWDYHHNLGAFESWLSAVERAKIRILNPIALVRWNLNKRYLFDLERAGIRVPRTVPVEPNADLATFQRYLQSVCDEKGRAVLKPAWGGDGVGVAMVTLNRVDEDFHSARRDLPGRPLILQSFLPEITTSGEISCVFIGGKFAHAFRTRPAPGDFRINTRYKPVPPEIFEPTGRLLESVNKVLQSFPTDKPPLYSRIDGVETADGGFVCIEAELIDPVLFMHLAPQTAGLFARVTQEYLLS